MNTKIMVSTFVVASLVLSALLPMAQVEAKQTGNSENTFPGNSLYGRMHNKHFMYKWGNQNFESFEDLMEHVRNRIQNFKQKKGSCALCTQSSSTVNVITQSVTDIDEDGATLRGKIELDSTEKADVWFAYGTTSTKLTTETAKVTLEYDDEAVFTKSITGLDSEMRYYYRAISKDTEGIIDYGKTLSFTTEEDEDSTENEPLAVTRTPSAVDNDSATLRGRIEMEDFENGIVFFVYGTDVNMLNDVEDDFSTYADIDESADALKKVQVDEDHDGEAYFSKEVTGLSSNTRYNYRIGVQYKDENDKDTLVLGEIKVVTTE